MSSAAVAANPGKADETVKCKGGKVSYLVASHISHLPCWYLKKTVISSRSRSYPTGSSTKFVPAASRARLMMPFKDE